MNGLKVGALRSRVTFYTVPMVQNTKTGQTKPGTPVLFGTYWADVRCVSNKEAAVAGQLRIDAEYAITMRYVPGITTKMQAIWNGITFNLVSVRNPDSRKIRSELFAKVITDA